MPTKMAEQKTKSDGKITIMVTFVLSKLIYPLTVLYSPPISLLNKVKKKNKKNKYLNIYGMENLIK